MRIHLVVTLGVVIAGCLLSISVIEWALVTLCIGGVIALECLNTALEKLADRITTEHDPLIGQAKDCAAAAVLVGAISSIAIGLMIFVPKVMRIALTGFRS